VHVLAGPVDQPEPALARQMQQPAEVLGAHALLEPVHGPRQADRPGPLLQLAALDVDGCVGEGRDVPEVIEVGVAHQDRVDVRRPGTGPGEELGRVAPDRYAVKVGELAATPSVPVAGVDQDRVIVAAQDREAVRDLPVARLAVQQQPERGAGSGELDHPDGVVRSRAGHAVTPPSTSSGEPVVKLDSEQDSHRAARATSPGSANRCSGYPARSSSRTSASGVPPGRPRSQASWSGGVTEPGQTMLTRIPSSAWSSASARQSISRPPLLAQ